MLIQFCINGWIHCFLFTIWTLLWNVNTDFVVNLTIHINNSLKYFTNSSLLVSNLKTKIAKFIFSKKYGSDFKIYFRNKTMVPVFSHFWKCVNYFRVKIIAFNVYKHSIKNSQFKHIYHTHVSVKENLCRKIKILNTAT